MLTTDKQVLSKRLELIFQQLEIQNLTIQQQQVILMAINNSFNAELVEVLMKLGNDALGDVYYRESDGKLTRVAIGTSGQILTVLNGKPIWQDVQAKFQWMTLTTATQQMAVNRGYIVKAPSLATLTLPNNSKVGDVIRVAGAGSFNWSVALNAGQSLTFGKYTTTTALTSTHSKDTAYLVCNTDNTGWSVAAAVGNLDVVGA